MFGTDTMPLIDARVYRHEVGVRIAEYVADGGTVHQFAAEYPELCNGSLSVLHWRRTVPEFAALLADAEKCCADAQASRALASACDKLDERKPAAVRLEVDARFRVAASLAPDKYGKMAGMLPRAGRKGEGLRPLAVVSDSELLAIASGGQSVRSIEAERGAITVPAGGAGGGGSVGEAGGRNCGVPDPNTSLTNFAEGGAQKKISTQGESGLAAGVPSRAPIVRVWVDESAADADRSGAEVDDRGDR